MNIKKKNYIIISFVGDGFLKYMVRIIVGLLIQIGINKKSEKDLIDILEKRSSFKKIAPPEGLYLNNVIYKKYR